MEYTPKLTLTPDMHETAAAAEALAAEEVAPKEEPVATLDISQLTEAEQKAVSDFAKQININDTNAVLQYGAGAQKNIADFSSSTLNNIRTKDMGEVGDMLGNLVGELKGFDLKDEDKKGILGFFKKAGNKLTILKAQYDDAESNVNKIAEMLEKHQITLLKDVALLDKMYELNKTYFKELAMYIIAGKQRLEEARATELADIQKKGSGIRAAGGRTGCERLREYVQPL